MRKVPIASLLPGMVVGHNVYNSSGNALVYRGVVLNKRYIESLKRLGIPALYIDDDSLPDFYIEDVIDEKSRIAAVKLAKNILSGRASTDAPLNKALVAESKVVINDIIEQLLENPSLMVNLTDIRSIDDYLLGHSVNVCVLSLITGVSLGYDKTKLMRLGLGSLMHDIGKTMIPPHILNKPGSLTNDEYSVIKRHSEYGYLILTNENSQIKKLSALIALQHHERYNGEGYPGGLKGDKIHAFSQIVGIADVYDAMTADRVYRKGHQPYEAYEMLAASGDYLFEYNLVRAFLRNIAAYPAGTLVKLSTDEIAVAIDTPKGFSLYPNIKVIYDAAGNKLPEPKDIKLIEKTTLTIVKVLKHEEITEIESKEKDPPQLA